MILNAVLDKFVHDSPVTAMVRASLEFALPSEDIDALFHEHATTQYTRELLFSSVVDLLSLVVLRIRPSVHNAYQACKDQLGVSAKALYDKLSHTEPQVCSALVHHVADRLQPVLTNLNAAKPALVPGYRTRILDGNHLAKTDRRLKVLRGLRPGPLPGQALVVFDPQWDLVTDVVCCEDGHAQERSLLDRIVPLVQAKDLWIADRNFCTFGFLEAIADRQAYFVIRQHASLSWRRAGRERYVGRSDTGRVYEQRIELTTAQGRVWPMRRITIKLDKPTGDGETVIHLVTNLPAKVKALLIAQLYRQRWTIETAFAQIEGFLNAEIATLAYPKAALLAFSVGLLAYNILSVVQGALRGLHGTDTVAQKVSAYALAEEATMTYRGMMVAVGVEVWQVFGQMTAVELAQILKEWASHIRLEKFRKQQRGPKKTVVKKGPKKPHVATARLLKKENKNVLK